MAGTVKHQSFQKLIFLRRKYPFDLLYYRLLLRLRLRGYVSPALLIDTDALSEENRTLFLLEAEDMTSPDIDPEALENDITLRGEVFRLLSPALSSENAHDREVARRALRYALSAFSSGKNPF